MNSQSDHESFRITTTRLTATLILAQGAPLQGTFSCATQAGGQDGFSQLAAMLNRGTDFVPFFPEGRDAPVLVNKCAIRIVELGAKVQGGPHAAGSGETMSALGELRTVDLLLDDGRELQGLVQVSAPLGHTRTLDNLNEAGRFLLLRTENRICLVNLAVVVLAADVV